MLLSYSSCSRSAQRSTLRCLCPDVIFVVLEYTMIFFREFENDFSPWRSPGAPLVPALTSGNAHEVCTSTEHRRQRVQYDRLHDWDRGLPEGKTNDPKYHLPTTSSLLANPHHAITNLNQPRPIIRYSNIPNPPKYVQYRTVPVRNFVL